VIGNVIKQAGERDSLPNATPTRRGHGGSGVGGSWRGGWGAPDGHTFNVYTMNLRRSGLFHNANKNSESYEVDLYLEKA
jgi:hypothetical protein